MRRVLFAANLFLALAPAACGGPAKKAAAAAEPRPLPHADRKDDPTALIPGDPPITQSMMDREIDLWEWVLDLRLTEEQRARGLKLWREDWTKKDAKAQAQWPKGLQGDLTFWENLAKLDFTERDAQRFQLQARGLPACRKSSDESDKWLAGLYDEAHKPGGGSNPVLVASDPPLTQDMASLYRTAMDYVLELQMTDPQRDERQRCFIEDWKKNDAKQMAKTVESWRKNLSKRPYDRRAWRVGRRGPVLDALAKSDGASDQWMLAAYQAAHKPGGEGNPVLADGDPPLTRDETELYCDRVEFGLDLSVLGGLTPDQRQHLQDLLVRDWKGTDASGKEAFLRALQKPFDKAVLLAELRGKPRDERSLLLLDLYQQEQDQFARLTEILKTRQQMQEIADEARSLIGDPYSHWRYNPSTGRLELVIDP